MKSVVTFTNGTGGKIILGVAGKTREVVGLGKKDVSREIDAIANAVSDNREPTIIPDAATQTIDGKTVIVLEAPEDKQHPCYIKAFGREGGVYVRIAGITHLTDEYMMKELLFEDSNCHFSQGLCIGLSITDKEIEELCKATKAQATKSAYSGEQKGSIKDVYRQQLRSWGILAERDGKDYPANIFTILTGCGKPHVTTQYDVFKGTIEEASADRRECDGPLWEQIEEVHQFALRNIHLGAIFESVYRQSVYEIPPDVIRELITNAVAHRSYLGHGTTQVAIYDDRLKIISPEKLPMGQTVERMEKGYSGVRNEALVYVFSYMSLIEH